MSASHFNRGLVLFGLLCFADLATGQNAQPLPEEPAPGGEVLLAGRLPWGATALPTGEILAPGEDKTLNVLDAQAHVLTTWQAPDRFSAPVSTNRGGPLTLAAAPLLSGQVVVLAWDAVTRTLAPSFVPSRRSEAAATAWTASGDIIVGWKDGQVESWHDGTRNWGAATGVQVSFVLVDNSEGIYVLGSGRVVLVDFTGRATGTWPLSGTPRGVLQTLAGEVLCWTDTGLWRKDDTGFVQLDASTSILGVAVDSQGRLIVTEPDRLRRMSSGGSPIATIVLPRRALNPAVVDERGRILLGTALGLEEWTYDGRLLGRLSDLAPSPVLLTENGLGAWGTSDWRVHVWSGFRWPVFGWPQDGGGQGRDYDARRSAGVKVRAVRWTDDPTFTYLFMLASSGKEDQQGEVLDRLETATAHGDALARAAWVNVILLKVARSGLTDLQSLQGKVINNWPLLRKRAFTLLAQRAGPEDRDELIELVHKEYDPAVVAAAIQAMTKSGWDGDGKLMRMLAETLGRMSDQAAVADVIIDAARSLWRQNGQSSDPALFPLVQAVFQGPYPTSVKLKAQKFFQDLLSAP